MSFSIISLCLHVLVLCLSPAPADQQFNVFHNHLLSSSVKRVREITSRISNEHRDIHGSVSKVGKSIDKVRIVSHSGCYIKALARLPGQAKVR